MPRRLGLLLAITDMGFIAYWVLAALTETGILAIPPAWMYAHYTESVVIAWNWSFLPLDLAFCATGLAAVAAARRGASVWRPLAIISLTLTMAAGGMAVSYWTILGAFDPYWFIPNLALVIWPLFFLPALVRGR